MSSQVSAGEPHCLLEVHSAFFAWWCTFLGSHRPTFADHQCFLTQFCMTDVDARSTHIVTLVQIITLQQVPKHTMLKTELSVFDLLFQISLSTADATALARCWTRQLCTRLHRVPMFFKHLLVRCFEDRDACASTTLEREGAVPFWSAHTGCGHIFHFALGIPPSLVSSHIVVLWCLCGCESVSHSCK